MRTFLVFLSLTFSAICHADRIKINSADPSIQLDAFEYYPDAPMAIARGVVMVIGGSGYSRAGFGGPSRLGKFASENGFIAIEWNKRGVITNEAMNDVVKDMNVYRTADFDNLLRDAQAVLNFVRNRYSHMEIYVIGGSEGSLVTTRLAELEGSKIKAIATFGTVVSSFVDIVGHQMMGQIALPYWKALDKNGDQVLSKQEYDPSVFREESSFLNRVPHEAIDVSGDGTISLAEMERFVVNHFINENPDPDYWLKTSGVPNMKSLMKVPTLFDRAKNIKIPYLIAHGEDDQLTPVKPALELEVFCKHLLIDNFTFEYFAGAGHAPNDLMFKRMIEFFEVVSMQ